MNRLRKLANYGQSYWMDDLSRDLPGFLSRLLG